jgi:ABC-type transporter Mla subunit MlaD
MNTLLMLRQQTTTAAIAVTQQQDDINQLIQSLNNNSHTLAAKEELDRDISGMQIHLLSLEDTFEEFQDAYLTLASHQA